VQYVSAIAQGDLATNRNGNVIRPYRVDFRVLPNFTGYGSVRIVVFADKFNTGTAPAVTDVFNDTAINSTFSDRAVITQRFKILHDAFVDMYPAVSATTIRTLAFSVPLRGEVKFVGNDATTASAGSGSLWFLYITSPAAAGNNIRWQLHYHDG